MSETIDCRSPQGITVGLVDAIISVARVLAPRDLSHPAVQEALKDLIDDEDVKAILSAGLDARSAAFLTRRLGD